MIVQDRRGVPQTVTFLNEMERIEKSLIGILGMEYDPSEHLVRTAKETDSLALVEIECIDLICSMEHHKLQRAKELIEPYRNGVMELEASERDSLLVEAIVMWVDREFKRSHQAFSRILAQYPKDVLTLFASHMLEFHMGWMQQMKETVQQAMPYWSESDPLYGYVKGIEAFCLEENGLYEEAIQAAEQAIRINPRDIYGIHALCHCFYETGQFNHGAAWMEEMMPNWRDNMYMRIHVWWHYALFKLYQLDFDQVMDVYHSEIRKKNNPTGLEDLDAAALMWRLSLIGKADASLWDELLECWGDYTHESTYWFNDLHALIVFFATGQQDKAERLIAHSIDCICDEQIGRIVTHAFEGIRLFSEEKYRESYLALQPILRPNTAFGGSHAQRDILEMTAIEAAIRANEMEQAQAFIQTGRCFKYDSPLRDAYLLRVKKMALS